MVQSYERILRESHQQLKDLAEPSPVMASALDQIASVRRNEEQLRSLGFVFPEEFQILEGAR